MTSFYTQKMVFTKSKNFDEGEGKITFYNTHCTKVQKSVWEREARTGGKSGVYDFLNNNIFL